MSNQDFTAMRAAMVSNQLRTNAVSDPRVVAAMDAVPREAYVPQDRRALAYIDIPVPLGEGRSLNAPLVTGRLLVESGIVATDRVLIVGAATGYAAAVAAELASHVVALEESPALMQTATALLGADTRITLVAGPLVGGCPDNGPYDLVLVDGAIEQIPAALWQQVTPGGRLACGLIEHGITRLSVGTRADESHTVVAFAEADAAHLPGFASPAGFTF